MDHGKLTDHNGKSVEFRNVILIMTTNAGAQDLASAAYRIHAQPPRGRRPGSDQSHVFPEFRNRLDATIGFSHLPPEIVRKVVEKFVMQLEAQLSERQINIELSDEAAKWLAEKGYDQQMGARPLARVIQEHVKKPLADEVLFGKLSKGGTVRVLRRRDAGRRGQAGIPVSEPRRREGAAEAARTQGADRRRGQGQAEAGRQARDRGIAKELSESARPVWRAGRDRPPCPNAG